VLTVALVYRLARLAFGELVGLLAALLCAISPFMVYYSQEARMYALATFCTTLSMFFLVRIVSGESPSTARSGSPDPGQKRGLGNPPGAIRSLWLAYFLATAAAIFTHYYALFVVVAQNASWSWPRMPS